MKTKGSSVSISEWVKLFFSFFRVHQSLLKQAHKHQIFVHSIPVEKAYLSHCILLQTTQHLKNLGEVITSIKLNTFYTSLKLWSNIQPLPSNSVKNKDHKIKLRDFNFCITVDNLSPYSKHRLPNKEINVHYCGTEVWVRPPVCLEKAFTQSHLQCSWHTHLSPWKSNLGFAWCMLYQQSYKKKNCNEIDDLKAEGSHFHWVSFGSVPKQFPQCNAKTREHSC